MVMTLLTEEINQRAEFFRPRRDSVGQSPASTRGDEG